MEKNNTTFKHPGDLDSEIWEWLKEHGTEETKQVIMMTARHFAGFTAAPLKQEQPEGLHFTPLNRLIQKIPSKNWNDTVNNYAKKLRDCLIKEGYLKDAGVLQGYISYMNGNNVPMATMDEQEQPEVELEKLKNKAELIANEIMMGVQANKYHTCIYDKASNDFNHSHLLRAALKGLELGINARREE